MKVVPEQVKLNRASVGVALLVDPAIAPILRVELVNTQSVSHILPCWPRCPQLNIRA